MKWGVLGSGNIAKRFLEAKPNEAYAIAGRTKEKSLLLQQEYGIPHIFESYEELLESDCDALYIAVPHGLHYKYGLEALEHGKAVLIEKPCALNEWEVQALVLKAKEKNLLLMEAMKTRFSPAYQSLVQEVKEGKFGKLKRIEVTFCSNVPDEFLKKSYLGDSIQGGALLDVGCYGIPWLLDFLGENTFLDSVQVSFRGGVDSHVVALYRKGDVEFQLTASLDQEKKRDVFIVTDLGCIEVPNFHRPSCWSFSGVTREFPLEGNDLSYEVHAFEKAYEQGLKEVPELSLEDSLKFAHELDRLKDRFTPDPDPSVYRM